MIERTALQELENWKNSEYRKPLILRGARQVGKTTIVNNFGKSYDNYLYFNLEKLSHRETLEHEMPLDDKINMMFAAVGKVRKQGQTLIFIDEIQNSPKTIALLRYFYEERSDLHIIAAGSLLENIVDVKASFPVGRVQYMALRPCSFREFATAMGKDNFLQILDNPQYSIPMHSELISLFNQYTIVGGMPEVVQRFSQKRDLLAMDDIYDTLLQAYRDDTEKYVRQNKILETVRFILETGWRAAGETVTLGNFMDSGYKSNDVKQAFKLLEKAMLLELAYPTESVQVPVMPQINRAPKLLWLDTGLVNYAAGVRSDIITAKNILDIWRGRIGEQITAQELLTLNNKVGQRRNFWARNKAQSPAEVDFIYQVDSQIIPIEVKMGHNSSLKSLHSFMSQSPNNLAVRVWPEAFSVDDVKNSLNGKTFRLINLPLYLVGSLVKVVRELG
ncbi:MAG: ATP-binding protein [Bacteroidales bacterium]|nr:ATP-binding protein [Bacteroidales bacterium]